MIPLVVWVCILWTGNTNVVIDNIQSQEDCRQFLRAYAQQAHAYPSGVCIPIRKAILP